LWLIALLLTANLFAVAATAPPTPAPLSPAAGASVIEPFTLAWSAVTDPSGIVGYNWQVSASSTFNTILAQNSTSGQTQDTISGLSNGTYFWRVQSANGAFAQSAWSQPRSFVMTGAGPGEPGAPTLSPTKGYSTFHPREVITFNWTAVPGAVSYVLQFGTDPSFPVTTTGQFSNIPSTTFSFGTGDSEGSYSARVYAVNANGISGVPSNVINYTVFYSNPLPAPPSLLLPAKAATLSLPILLTWTDVPNPQPSGYELQIARDSSFSSIEDDVPQINNPARTELSLTPGIKFWRVRSSQGDAGPLKAAVTAWSAAGTFTVNQSPSAPVSLTAHNTLFYSGDSNLIAVQLTSAVPASGSLISLASSNPAAVSVPATITMPGNTAWTQFSISASQVTAPTPVTLTATLNSGTASVQLTVMPPSLKSVSISPSFISGGAQPEAIIMLNGQAPAGGAAVSLSSDSPAALPPAAATVPAGSQSVSIPLPTTSVAANTVATITATWNGSSVNSQFTVLPPAQPSSISLSPSATSGTNGSFATVMMASPATNDETFEVASSNPAVASTPNSVIIPSGLVAGGFNIFTAPVTTQTVVTISVTAGGVTRSANLTLLPVAPTPTPTPSQTVTLTVNASGRSGERITSSPVGVSVATGSTGSAAVASGTPITLSVSNGRVAIWSGACSGNKTKTCTFTPTANSTVSANVQ
jgi:hypothetical protein